VQLMKINKRMCDLHCTSIKLVHKASSYNKWCRDLTVEMCDDKHT
jgi:hypothetical protein